jgi:hypothetical protein
MDATHILSRLEDIEKGLADFLRKHRQAMDKEDLRQARQPQGEISDLIARVQNLTNRRLGAKERRGLSVW